jgi:hypothetical protein
MLSMAALLASALAGVLVAGTVGGRYALAGAVALAQLVLVLGIARGSNIPGSRISAAVALVAGVATVGLIATQPEAPPDPDTLLPLVGTAGLGFVAMIVVQLLRRDGRERLTASLTLGVTTLLLATVGATWLGLWGEDIGTALLLLALAGTATAAAIAAFPGPLSLWALGATIAAASVGLLLHSYAPQVADVDLNPGVAALVGGVSGLAAVIGLGAARMVAADSTIGGRPMPALPAGLLSAALPVVVAAPVAFAVGWAVAEGVLV